MSLVSEVVSNAMIEDLPNLKIEIDNDLNQKMDTDDDSSINKARTASSDTEEGELVDEDDSSDQVNLNKTSSVATLALQNVPTGRSILKYDTKEYVELQQQASVKNPNGSFVTGVNIFSPEEQAKLDKRAQRFGIEASDAKVLTEKLLKKLYKSMGVKPTDKNIRVEALHMNGTEQMTTKDVFNYFKDYGPASLEWISNNSCNVVWLDDMSAARALLGLSLHISGQTDSKQHSHSGSDVDMESQAVKDKSDISEESDAVAADDLGVKLPPGLWRRGAPHSLSPCIFLRFATTNDRSRDLSKPGFAKHGSHQSGGYVGLISESRKRRMQGELLPPIVFEDVGDEHIPKPGIEETDNVNPWGMLAKTWSQFDKARQPKPPSPIIERVIPLPSRMTPPPSPPGFSSRPRLIARTRRRRERDQPAQVIIRKVSDSEDDSSDNEEWRTRSKLPRMRMHADDEEIKLEKRLKKSRRIRSSSFSPTRKDLRRKIEIQRNHSETEKSPEPEPVVEEPEEEDEIPDLRVAVAADRSPGPEDTKVGIRQTLFQSGNVKSVLRGARGHNENEDEEDIDEHVKSSSVRRHRSRSKERRKHHRKHRKENSYHKSRRRGSDSGSDERTSKTLKSTIRRKSPEKRERTILETKESRSRHENKERRRSPHESKERSPRHERRRRNEDRYKSGENTKLDRRRHEGEKRSSNKDLRSKLAHKHKTFDSNNEFRSKSPLQIEIDNDEYFKGEESD